MRTGRAPDARVDDGEVDAQGHVRDRVREHERALQHGLRRYAVRDVDHLHVGSDPLDHAVARANEIVAELEVREERDEPVPAHGADSRADATNSPATASGSLPRARRIQRPSGSATSAVSASPS